MRRLAGVAGRHRVLSVAACLVVLLVALAGTVGALVRSSARPTRTGRGGAAPASRPAPAHGPTDHDAATSPPVALATRRRAGAPRLQHEPHRARHRDTTSTTDADDRAEQLAAVRSARQD